MQWLKQGLLFKPENLHEKLVSHAANPLPVHLEKDVFRVFFSGRDEFNRSSVGHVDVNVITRDVLDACSKPDFVHGDDQSFYSHGVSIGNCYRVNGLCYMLFMGWKCEPGKHWYGTVGRLIMADDLSLHLDSPEPFMPLDETDPVSLSYPWVMRREAGYAMWYGSTVRWDEDGDEMVHVIKSAVSENGHDWKRNGLAVPFEEGVAQAFSRPTVIELNGLLHMWFSYRSGVPGQTYRIGYAVCDSQGVWKLDLEHSGIDVSKFGWDSEMIEYPYIFRHGKDILMMYNGNSLGRSGFGLAKLEM